MNKVIFSIGIMAGTIIGAGVFSLPYIFMQIGVLNGLVFLVAMAVVMALFHLFYADLVVTTRGRHNFVGFMKIYLGKAGMVFGIITSVIQMMFVLVIYLVLVKSFIALIFPTSYSPGGVLLFWILGSIVACSTLRRLAMIEFLVAAGMVVIMALVFVFALPSLFEVSLNNAVLGVGNFLLPIGPLFFALAGRVAVVEVVRELGKGQKKKIKLSIILGTILPALIYALFILAVVVLSGSVTSDAVSGLVGNLPLWVLALISVLGCLSLWSSYTIIGFDVNDILKVDLKIPAFLRVAFIVLAPMVFYMLGFQNFIKLVTFAGAVFTPIVAVLIILMWFKAKKRYGQMALLKNMPGWAMVALTIFFVIVLVDQILKIVWPMLT
ncbi:MAG: aromatic amino acid transport family protein [Patescibacteria group bacterium]